MGLFGSKEEPVLVYDSSRIFFDDHGNLRHSGPVRDREDELRKIMIADQDEEPEPDEDDDDDAGNDWYIIDTAWLNAWLAFSHLSAGVSPSPGPCDNLRLLVENHEEKRWEAKPGLVMAAGMRGGDYRRVSRQAWEQFVSLYPGSGPTIIGNFTRDDPAKSHGRYDTSNWRIDKQYEPKKEKKHKKRKVKKEEEEEKKATEADENSHPNTDGDAQDPGALDVRAPSEDAGTAGIKMTNMSKAGQKHEKIDKDFVDDLLFNN